MDTSFDAAQTQPPFGPGELERWFASFDSFTAKKGHHSALSLFAIRFGNKGFPKFSDPEWLGLVRARQAGIQAEASLKETPARSRAIRRQHTKVAREGELAAELIAAGVVCLIVKESRLIAEQAMDFRGTLAFERTDSGESCALEIRRGVCQFHDVAPKDAGATLRLDGEFLIEWLFGRTSVEDALAGGKVEVAGDARMATDFLAKFEPFNQTTEIAIAGR